MVKCIKVVKGGGDVAAFITRIQKEYIDTDSIDLSGEYSRFVEVNRAKALAHVLPSMTKLKSLKFIGNNIGPDGAFAIAQAIVYVNTDNTTNAVISVLTGDTTVSVPLCDIHKNKINYDTAIAIRTAMEPFHEEKLPHLRTLIINNNAIGDVGVVAIAHSIKFFTQLTELNLSANKIGNIGAKALADALPSMRALELLNISSNKIDVGVVALADALRSMQTLKSLNLSANKIDDAGAIAISTAIPSMLMLEYLSLWGNNIGDAGAMAIAIKMALSSMIELKHLILYANTLMSVAVKKAIKQLNSTTALQALL